MTNREISNEMIKINLAQFKDNSIKILNQSILFILKKITKMNNLKKKDIDFFLENGYLAIGKIIDDDFLKKLQLEYDKEFIKGNLNKTIRNLSKKDDFGEEINKINKVFKNEMTLNVIEKNSGQEMLQIMQMSERNIFFRKLIYYPSILIKLLIYWEIIYNYILIKHYTNLKKMEEKFIGTMIIFIGNVNQPILYHVG